MCNVEDDCDIIFESNVSSTLQVDALPVLSNFVEDVCEYSWIYCKETSPSFEM